MAIVAANRRSQMMLFARPHDPQSQRIRLVLEEKGIANIEVVELKPGETSEDLLDLNPYGTLPTLVDRELVLYEPRIIMEYLDERFPHPPLMPVDPVARARFRLALYRIEQDIYRLVPILEEGGANDLRRARKELRETLMGVVDIFNAKSYFLSDEYSLVDCTIAPVLWRLEQYGVELPKQGAPILRYAKRLHERRLTRRNINEDDSDMGD
ncbi:MAG: glutathione S-transferase N-terminal domain-containing protein [Nevskiales bacterium]